MGVRTGLDGPETAVNDRYTHPLRMHKSGWHLLLLLTDLKCVKRLNVNQQNFASSPFLCCEHLASNDEENVEYQTFAPFTL